MAIFGQYETVREVHRGGMGAVATARRAGGGADEFVVKELRVAADIMGHESAARAVAVFLERTAVQARAAAGEGAHWAPVHEAAACEGGAYYVTGHYPRSAQRLIHGRVKLDGRALHTIVESVLAGLREVHAACARFHGNLKATNVLIAGGEGGGAAVTRVVLTDPAEPEGASSVAPDLRAVGELIYGLVMHQGFRVRGGWPVPMSPEWSRLGASGKAWLDLCNRLLDPALQDNPPSLDELAAALPAPEVKGRSRTPMIIGGAAAALAVLGGGAFLLFRGGGSRPADTGTAGPSAAFSEAAWRELCEAYYNWFGPLDEYLNTDREAEQRRERLRKDAALGAILGPLLGGDRVALHPRQIAGGENPDLGNPTATIPAKAMTADAAARTRAALDVVHRVRDSLTGGGAGAWPLRVRAEALIQTATGRGWTGPAEQLRRAIERLKPSAELGPAIEALLAETRLMDDLAKLNDVADTIAASGDTVLATFPAMVGAATEPRAGQNAETSAAELRQTVSGLADLADRLKVFLAGDWTRTVDRDLFMAESSIHKSLRPGETPTPEDFSRWFAEAQSARFRSLEEPHPFAGPTLGAALAQVKERVTQLRSQYPDAGPEAEAYAGAAQKAEEAAAAGAARPWNRSTHDDVLREYEALAASIKSLGGDVLATIRRQEASANQSIEAARAALAQDNEPTGSPEVDKVWRSLRDRLAQEPTAKAISDRADQVRRFLRESVVAKAPPLPEFPAGRDWVAGLTGAARAERERALGEVAAGIPWDGATPPPTFDAAGPALDAYTAWCRAAVALAADAAAVEDRLEALYPLDERVAGKSIDDLLSPWSGDAVFTSAAVQGALRPLLERVKGVRDLGAVRDREALLAAARDTARPERAFAAWRRLGRPDVPWPAVVRALEDESGLQKLLVGVAGAAAAGSPDPEPRRAVLRQELAEGARQRWARHMESAGTPEEIRAGATLKTSLNGDESLLDDRARFNLLLVDLESAAKDLKQGDDEVRARIAAFVRAAGTLRGATAIPAGAGLLEALSPMTSAAPEAPKVDIARIGPGDPRLGQAAWQAQPSADNTQIRFTRQFPQGPQTLTFVRVTPQGGEPAFLCTEEATLGLVLSLVGAGRQWDAVGGLLPDYNPQFGDNRLGPRVWQWNGPKAPGRTFGKATDWFSANAEMKPRGANEPYPAAPPDLPPPPPSVDSPLNYVPPGAALLLARMMGCRLPTSAEALAAISAELSGQTLDVYIAAVTPNLRDETWNTQRAYIDGLVQAGRLSGINARQRGASEGTFPWQPRDATSFRQGYNDHAVWLGPAAGGAGASFKNMIGNAAEWVFDDAPAAEQIAPGTPAPDQVSSTLGRGAALLRVIGGSAQSPPQTDPLIPVAAPASPAGYSDVGFRLAFGAAGAVVAPDPLAVQLAKVLATPRYLLP